MNRQMKDYEQLYTNFDNIDEFWKKLLKHKNIIIHDSAKDGTYNGAHDLLIQQKPLHDISIYRQSNGN